jgi:hypothetical protein
MTIDENEAALARLAEIESMIVRTRLGNRSNKADWIARLEQRKADLLEQYPDLKIPAPPTEDERIEAAAQELAVQMKVQQRAQEILAAQDS